MSSAGRAVAVVAAAVTVTTLAVPATAAVPAEWGGPAAVRFHPGSAGLGDPYFPKLGNGGYDVAHYGLHLRYTPRTRMLAGTATIRSQATTNLSRFDLDLSGLHVHAVRVDGTAARWTRRGQELVVTPASGLRRGSRFTTVVRYSGSPKTIKGSPIVFGADYGWQYTKDGAFVGDEPNAAHTWFPCNDHPSDKATYAVDMSVPKSVEVVSNGELHGRHRRGARVTYAWRETKPEATYLETVDIGHWKFVRGHTPDGIPEFMAVDPALATGAARKHVFALTGRITDFWASKFGPYPFTSTGAIVDNVPHVGFSLETQTRPLYGFVPDPGTMSHELSHQWFGDSVSVASWNNIWLNEGFATFAQWLWAEHTGGHSTYRIARSNYRQIPARDAFWHQAVANPKRPTMFSSAVYYRGGMAMAALRHEIGSPTFFRLLRTWTRTHRYGNGTTQQFVALADRVSGRDLHRFFHVWVWAKRKPAHF